MDKAQSEEVMRVKNQNAIQRAIENDQQQKGYKPSVNALKNKYDNLPHPRGDYKSAGASNENQPPLSARNRQHKSSIAQRIEAEALER